MHNQGKSLQERAQPKATPRAEPRRSIFQVKGQAESLIREHLLGIRIGFSLDLRLRCLTSSWGLLLLNAAHNVINPKKHACCFYGCLKGLCLHVVGVPNLRLATNINPSQTDRSECFHRDSVVKEDIFWGCMHGANLVLTYCYPIYMFIYPSV